MLGLLRAAVQATRAVETPLPRDLVKYAVRALHATTSHVGQTPSTPSPPPVHPGLLQRWASADVGFRTLSSGAVPSGGQGSGDDTATPSGRTASAEPPQHKSSTISEALDKLVDVAVAMVEQGKMAEAIVVLKQGIEVLEASYPGSAEVGELHNQAALLLYFQARCDEAARHATTALDITRSLFGSTNMLTAHRLVRLGTIKFGQGQLAEALPLLEEASAVLQEESGEHDPGRAEANFYLALSALAASSSSSSSGAGAVTDAEPALLDSLQRMKRVLGQESMIITLALTQHGRLVLALSAAGGFQEAEALYRQHLKLQEARDPASEDSALAAYKLAVLYYSQDLLPDARSVLQKATQLLRGLFPEEHDLVLLCKHRLGMIAAAAGDHRAAGQLLKATAEHYRSQDADHALAAEADFGLAAARFRAGDRANSEARTMLVEEMRAKADAMAAGLGADHLLVQAALRMFTQLEAMLQRQQR